MCAESSQSTEPEFLPIRGNVGEEIRLTLISDSQDIFVLNDKQLHLKRPLDRDTLIDVKVQVTDRNDNPPQFINLPYSVKVNESADVGFIVFDGLMTSDGDANENALVEFYVIPGSGTKTDGFGTFSIDSPLNGEIILKKQLDYDKIDNYETTIIAIEDRLSNQLKTSTSIVFPNSSVAIEKLKVLPILSTSSTVGFVDENSAVGTIVFSQYNQPIQFAIDSLELNRQFYRLEFSSNKFNVNDAWWLIVTGQLDREQQATIYVKVTLYHIHQLKIQSSLNITVNINDVNDNWPRFEDMPAINVIKSNQQLTTITQVRANDADTNDEITYAIDYVANNAENLFRINSSNGIIEAIQSLTDGETYLINVKATDTSGKSSNLDVEVRVTSPLGRLGQIESSRHIFDIQVSEAVAVGSIIMSLQPGPNPLDDVTYSIMEGNEDENFALSPITGILTVRHPLDREQVSRYTLGLRAIDKYGMTTITIVNIEVTDINDCNPLFVGQPYVFYVDENVANAIIGKVKAIDADAWMNGVVYYESSPNAPITVDETTGEIRVVRQFDYERQPTEVVVISARDGADQPRIATATVTIIVRDVSDELPRFIKSVYDVSVAENLANVDVVKVTAIDADVYKQVTYVLRSGPINKFTVDPITGVVKTIWPLDFEDSTSHILIIGTKENPYDNPDSSCLVRVSVVDRNDITPHFSSVPPVMKVTELTQNGTIIGKVSATDGDGTVYY
ncbi:hypothetical protein CHUAL_007226 [Chamberlinius hualienensis]